MRPTHVRPSPGPLPRLTWPVLAALVVIVTAGAALRAWGADAGAPFRMGVDEPVIISNALRMVRSGNFHPHFFDYGGLTLYLHSAVAVLTFLAGAMDGRWSHLDAVWEGDLLAAGRLATALLGTLTIVVVFRIALRSGTAAALIAALTMAVLPGHVREAHFILTDTPLTFFVALTLLLSIRAAEQGRVSAVAIAGIAVGLATAVKYNGVLALLMPCLVAATLAPGRRLAAIAAAIGASGLTFLICAPYTVLDLPAFLNGMAALMQSYNQHRPLLEAMSNYLGYLRNWFTWPGVLPTAVGYVALLVALAGAVTLLWRTSAGPQRIAALLVVGFPLVYFWFVSTQALQYGRYLLPIGPMICVCLAVGLTTLVHRVERSAARRAALVAIVLVLLAPPGASAVSWSRAHALTTTSEQAAQWIVTHTTAGDHVVAEAFLLHLPPRFVLTRTNSLIRSTTEQYQQTGITYLVASSALSRRYYADPANNRDAITAHRTLLALTEPVATFVPTTDHPGETITILRVPRPAD